MHTNQKTLLTLEEIAHNVTCHTMASQKHTQDTAGSVTVDCLTDRKTQKQEKKY